MSALALGRWASRFKILHSQATLFRTSSSTYFFTSSTANKSEDPVRPEPPPIRVSLTESAGRGVFATRRIGAGDLIHTARPLVAHPLLSTTHSVCYFCLRKLKATSQTQAIQFCSNECEEQSMGFYNVERRANWSDYDNYCRMHGLKYPLLVKRLACMVISGVAAADSFDILQPESLSPVMVSEMEEGFNLLRGAFTKANICDEQVAYLLTSAAASVEAEAAVGNAVYMLPSFYNHDCDPNAHILWIENADARLKVLRDVEAGCKSAAPVGQRDHLSFLCC
ncbi:hypothetical protein I3842_09G026600 [Carya illinoinensis]|uniref:SET domain-containing protein n=1 Tax=Carya illinoinensis TaxID=32201 RepID=A0A922DZP8_CARIL|nr:hypothetical protein I3842_09G026600 [Carya illinoinensis]KAG6693962.1 hypothetical protein I3842_09G026600 [Carya illinoinensis]